MASADWDAMETVSVELGEYFFEPNVITLQVDQPYKLELKNAGELKHEFTADAFYRSVAFRKAQDTSGEYKGPHPSEIEVFAGQQTDLYLIPTRWASTSSSVRSRDTRKRAWWGRSWW